MKAMVRDGYGSPEVLRFEDVEKPTPGPGEVLVRVRAASLNTADLEHLRGTPFVARVGMGLTRPRARVPGFDMAGEVESVGQEVSGRAPGDRVWADLFSFGSGAFAEYVCSSADAFSPIPTGVSFEAAAAVPHSGILALQGLSGMGGFRAGQHVLINGAGGCVGPFAVQIAKARGAEVSAVDHTDKLGMLRSLGADHVIDYTRESFTHSGRRYDFILDIAPDRWVLGYRGALRPGGRYVQIARGLGGFFQAAALGGLVSLVSDVRMGVFGWQPNAPGSMAEMSALVASGDVRPLIDRVYPLESVPDALGFLESGRALGKLVVTV